MAEGQRSIHEEPQLLIILEWGQEVSEIGELVGLLAESPLNCLPFGILPGNAFLSFDYD